MDGEMWTEFIHLHRSPPRQPTRPSLLETPVRSPGVIYLDFVVQ